MNLTEVQRPKRHVEKALIKLVAEYKGEIPNILDFINIEHLNDIKGVVPIVSFKIQSDPIGEVGINGVQAVDMLRYVKCLFESLNEAFSSPFNEATIQALTIALHWQDARTKDRQLRQVEGYNKA